jgi:hypothetical protein
MRLILLILLSSFAIPHSSFSAKPNVLIIQTDEHNFRTLGCYRKLLPPLRGPEARESQRKREIKGRSG